MGHPSKEWNEKRSIARRLLTDEVVAAIVNGESKADIITKLKEGIFTNCTSATMSHTAAYNYWNDALEKIKYNCEISAAEKRDILWNRYEALYNDCIELGNYQTARAILNDQLKLFGLASPEQKEVTVNDAVISFGFGKNV